jgi:hypothetical protein
MSDRRDYASERAKGYVYVRRCLPTLSRNGTGRNVHAVDDVLGARPHVKMRLKAQLEDLAIKGRSANGAEAHGLRSRLGVEASGVGRRSLDHLDLSCPGKAVKAEQVVIFEKLRATDQRRLAR